MTSDNIENLDKSSQTPVTPENDSKTRLNPYTDPHTGLFMPGNPGGPGRPKGSKNKFTTVKEMVIQVLEDLGGADWIYQFAQQHPRDFLKLIDKLLPESLEVAGPNGTSVSVDVRAQLVDRLAKLNGDKSESK